MMPPRPEYSISAYSPEIDTVYSKRTPKCELNVTAENVQKDNTAQFDRTLHISAKISSASAAYAPHPDRHAQPS